MNSRAAICSSTLSFLLPVFCSTVAPAQENASDAVDAAESEAASGSSPVLSHPAWIEDYSAAVAAADGEGKALLLLFTGTDWIDLCREFYEGTLIDEAFTGPVGGKAVFVRLEFPEDNKAPADERETFAQRQLLRDAYRVRGFPTVVLTDTGGRPFAFTGYQKAAPEKFAEHCLELIETMDGRVGNLRKAGTVQGVERAEALVQGIPDLPGNLSARFFRKEMAAAIEADPEDTLGIHDEYKRLIADVDYAKKMQELAAEKDWSAMERLSDEHIEKWGLEGQALQSALMNRYGAQAKMSNYEGMIRSLLLVVEADPESPLGRQAKAVLVEWRKNRVEADKKKAEGGEGKPGGGLSPLGE